MNRIVEMMNERHRINQLIRSFFILRNFVEVETPTVVRSPGMEPNLDPLETKVIEPDGTEYPAGLITSPEYSMKKLLGIGMEKIFTICKVFRNKEEFGGSHNTEFSILEWYSQGNDYQVCMDETEELVKMCAQEFGQKLSKFKRIRVRDLFLEKVGIDLDEASVESLREACEGFKIRTDRSDSESDLFYRLFLEKIEPNLGDDPIFIYDYPKHQAALSRLTSDGLYGERFELYWHGIELCNGFTELTDGEEQMKRFVEEMAERREANKHIFPIDRELIEVLPKMANPTSGNALGIDRLHMALVGVKQINQVLPFPIGRII